MDLDLTDPLVADLVASIDEGHNILLHAPGGTGKTHMLRCIAKHYTELGKTVYLTATTGVAAVNLTVKTDLDSDKGSDNRNKVTLAGSTLHSWAGIGIVNEDTAASKIYSRVMHNPKAKTRWIETDILIVDEVSMMGGSLLEKLDYVGRMIKKNKSAALGGIQLILSGDFLQLPPVKDSWIFSTEVWQEIDPMCFILSEPKRYPDEGWFNMLLRIRKGEQSKADIKALYNRVRAYDKWLETKDTDIIQIKPTILYSKKIDVEAENEIELEKLPTKSERYIAQDSFTAYTDHAKYDYYIKALDDVIPKSIILKKGAQVMLKANLDVEHRLVNGSRGVVVDVVGEKVMVEWMGGNITAVTTHTWNYEDRDGMATRTQIPLVLAWTMTIHKSQSCTMDYVICNLGPSVFSAGQAYVALSRVRSLDGLLIEEFYPPSIKVDVDALEYVNGIEASFEDRFGADDDES